MIQEILIKIYYKMNNEQKVMIQTFNTYKECYNLRDIFKNNKEIQYEGYKLYKIVEKDISNYEI